MHPIKRRNIKKINQIDLLVSKINILLFYFKLKDDIIDADRKSGLAEKYGFKSIAQSVLAKRLERKFLDQKPGLMNIDKTFFMDLKNMFGSINQLEKNHNADLELISNLFGNIVQKIILFCSHKLEIGINEDILLFSKLIGKWVYTIDAIDDLGKDIKNKSYNPYIYKYKDLLLDGLKKDDFIINVKKDQEKKIHFLLTHIWDTYYCIEKELNYFKIEIDDIIYRSLLGTTNKILNKNCEGDKSERKSI